MYCTVHVVLCITHQKTPFIVIENYITFIIIIMPRSIKKSKSRKDKKRVAEIFAAKRQCGLFDKHNFILKVKRLRQESWKL